MSDFSEIENDLRKLRPAQPSPVLFQRVEEALTDRRTGASDARRPRMLSDLLRNWESWGFGLAAAAVLVVFAALSMHRGQEREGTIAQALQSSGPRPSANQVEPAAVAEKFVPAGGTRVVYNTRNEGLHFTDGSRQPLRRVRYQARQTWQWRNPTTGASLRVSYPSEEVVLIPVSGQ
jgi:hypothetical protein